LCSYLFALIRVHSCLAPEVRGNDEIVYAYWGSVGARLVPDTGWFRKEPGEVENEESSKQGRRYSLFFFFRRKGR
jgi:hypothetical protein